MADQLTMTENPDGTVSLNGCVRFPAPSDDVAVVFLSPHELELFTPFNEDGYVRTDLGQLGFQPVGWLAEDDWDAAACTEPVDIIDRIDALVNDQLAGGEPRRGYDFGDPTFPKCPHCSRSWHGLKLTEQIADMYAHGQYNESYRVADDDSPVLCEGSEFIGPMQYPYGTPAALDMQLTYAVFPDPFAGPGWRALTMLHPGECIITGSAIINSSAFSTRRWWRTTLPADVEIYTDLLSPNYLLNCGADSLVVAGSDLRVVELADNGTMTVLVLAERAPDIAGTWEPVTAPGVTDPPSGISALELVLAANASAISVGGQQYSPTPQENG